MASERGEGASRSSRSKSSGVGKALSIVALLLAAIALVVASAIPGPAGIAGDPGTDGANGADGADGADGASCWDLNGNGVPDVATEDRNGDAAVDVLDCRGAQGAQGRAAVKPERGREASHDTGRGRTIL